MFIHAIYLLMSYLPRHSKCHFNILNIKHINTYRRHFLFHFYKEGLKIHFATFWVDFEWMFHALSRKFAVTVMFLNYFINYGFASLDICSLYPLHETFFIIFQINCLLAFNLPIFLFFSPNLQLILKLFFIRQCKYICFYNQAIEKKNNNNLHVI